jgi:hypothetical protein
MCQPVPHVQSLTNILSSNVQSQTQALILGHLTAVLGKRYHACWEVRRDFKHVAQW